jgi:hypothetical protein
VGVAGTRGRFFVFVDITDMVLGGTEDGIGIDLESLYGMTRIVRSPVRASPASIPAAC